MSEAENYVAAFEKYVGQGSGFPGPNKAQARYQQLTGTIVAGVDYCAFTVYAAAADAGLSSRLSSSGYVSQQVLAMKQRGYWYSRRHTPARGDIIVFCWEHPRTTADSSMDVDAIAEETWHIGVVAGFDGTTVRTIEGNNDDSTGYHSYRWDSSVIYGYGRPFSPAGVDVNLPVLEDEGMILANKDTNQWAFAAPGIFQGIPSELGGEIGAAFTVHKVNDAAYKFFMDACLAVRSQIDGTNWGVLNNPSGARYMIADVQKSLAALSAKVDKIAK